MKYLILCSTLLLFQTVTTFAEDIPILVLNENKSRVQKVSITEEDYSSFLNKSLNKALKKNQFKKYSNDFELDYLVIGMSTDVRVGFFSWNLSASSGVEYHLKVVPNE